MFTLNASLLQYRKLVEKGRLLSQPSEGDMKSKPFVIIVCTVASAHKGNPAPIGHEGSSYLVV